jgi:hypothetical protein
MSEEVKLVEIGNNNYQIGENKISIPEPNILFIESIGNQTDEVAKVYYDFYLKLTNNIEGKMHVVVDINNSKKSSTQARRTWKALSELEQTGKVALFGLHPVAKVLATFVMRITNKNDISFFKTKEEAFAWVKG